MLQVGKAELFWAPEGNMVFSTFDELRNELVQGVQGAADSWDMLVIDMAKVDRIDVRGIQLISEFYHWSQNYGRRFMLMNVHLEILRYLRLFRLHTKFPIGLDKTSAELAAARQVQEEEARVSTTINVRGDVPRKRPQADKSNSDAEPV
jgi:anti-anti-sigma regulatory factor